MKLIEPTKACSGYTEHAMKIDPSGRYLLCDIGIAFNKDGGLGDLSPEACLQDGVFEHNGIYFALFGTTHGDGVYPFYEADACHDPDSVLLDCKSYFADEEPLDQLFIDSGRIALIQDTVLSPSFDPLDVGPRVNLARFDEEDYEDSQLTIYESNKAIYLIDYLLVRDFRYWDE